MTFQNDIQKTYGVDPANCLRRISKWYQKLAKQKNRKIFLLRCKYTDTTPIFLNFNMSHIRLTEAPAAPEEPDDPDAPDAADAPEAPEVPDAPAEESTEPAEQFTIRKIQIKPGKTLQWPNDAIYPSRLPVISSKSADYVPMVYTFRVPSPPGLNKISDTIAKSPPLYMLLDHTIAVIWMLFAAEEGLNGPLGISQLQWALAFLRTIRTRQGDYTPDTQVCIDAIENILIGQYADLSEDMRNLTRINETIHYADGAFGSSLAVTKAFPFSLNYSEIFDKATEDKGPTMAVSITSVEAEEELEKIKKAAGVVSIENLESAAKEQAVSILKLWKSEQVDKIKDELKRLREIEDRMREIDDNFEGYVEDDLNVLVE